MHGPHCVRSIRLECQNKHFLVRTSSSFDKSILFDNFGKDSITDHLLFLYSTSSIPKNYQKECSPIFSDDTNNDTFLLRATSKKAAMEHLAQGTKDFISEQAIHSQLSAVLTVMLILIKDASNSMIVEDVTTT